jgi:hypothetical protein
MRLRMAALAVTVVCGAMLLGPPVAGAQTTPTATSFKNIPVRGTATNHKKFTGRYTVNYFTTKRGKTFAVGKLSGRIGHRHVTKNNVMLPVTMGGSSAQTSATCPILNLTLGPLDLNLLGLRVQLNRVHLQITAIQGPGNLLGNLLCGVANLLNTNTAATQGSQLTGLLNIVLQLVNTPALANL